MSTRQQYESQVTEDAADWLIRLDADDSASQRQAFLEWLQQSSHHMREFLFVTEAFRRLDDMDPQRRIELDLDAVRRQTEAPFPLPIPNGLRQRPTPRWRRPPAIAASVAVLAALALAWKALPDRSMPHTYTTGIGEQRSFKLEDGSTLHLNVMSHAKVQFSGQTRRVDLLEGEALFVVQPDAGRPFRVATDSATVEVIGTQFNVSHRHGSTTVSVLDGAVKAGNREVTEKLQAGEEACITQQTLQRNATPDLADVTAWRQRRLVFRDDTLGEVAAEFNRYNTAQIHVEGKARDKQLLGIFNADDPQSLMLFLQRDESLMIERRSQDFLIRPR